MRRALPLVTGLVLLTGCSWRGLAYEQHKVDVTNAAEDATELAGLRQDRGQCDASLAGCLDLVAARSGHVVVAPGDGQDVLQLVAADAGLAPDSIRLDLARVRVAGDVGRVLLRSGATVTVDAAAPGPAVAGAASTLGTVGDDRVLSWSTSDGVAWQAWFPGTVDPDVVTAVAGALVELPAVPAARPPGAPTLTCSGPCGYDQAGWFAPATASATSALVGAQGSLETLVTHDATLVQVDVVRPLSTVSTITLDPEVGAGPDTDVRVAGADEALTYALGPEQVVLVRNGGLVIRLAVAGGTRADAVALAGTLRTRAAT